MTRPKRQPVRLAVMIPTLVEWLSRVDGVTVSNGDMAGPYDKRLSLELGWSG